MKRKSLAAIVAVLSISMALAGCGTSNDASAKVVEDSGAIEYSASDDVAGSIASNVDMDSEEVKLLLRLEKAYNDRDLYGIIECFDPSVSNAFFAAAKIMGLDSDSVKNMMPFTSKMIAQSGAVDGSYWGAVELTPLEILDDGMSGVIKYQVDIVYEDGSDRSFEDTAAIVKVEDVWYLSAFQPIKESEYAPIPVNPDITEADVEGELFIIGNTSWRPCGYINESGKEIVSPYFREMKGFYGDYCAVTMDGQKWGFIDRMGNLVIDYIFPDVGEGAAEGYFSVYDGSAWGALNPETGEVVECNYEAIGMMGENGLIPVKQSGYWGISDKNGNMKVDYLYTEVENQYHGNRIGVAVNNAWGIIDGDGNYVLPLSADRQDVETTDVGLSIAEEDDRFSIYDKDMNQIFTDLGNYERISEDRFLIKTKHSEGYQLCHRYDYDDRSMLIDEKGNILADSDEMTKDYISMYPGELDNVVNYGYFEKDSSCADRIVVRMNAKHNVLNIMDYDGNILLNEWPSYTYTSENFVNDGKMFFIGSDFGYTKIYDLVTGDLITELPFQIWRACQLGSVIVCETSRDDIEGDVLIDVSNNDYTDYKVYNGAHWSPDKNDYPIVTDGIFYGVYTAEGFIGKGLTYSSVDWDGANRIYTLEYGAATEQYRIGKDGTVNKIQ